MTTSIKKPTKKAHKNTYISVHRTSHRKTGHNKLF